jgi:hypothetical protein
VLIGFRAPGRALGERTLERRDPEQDRIRGADDDADPQIDTVARQRSEGEGILKPKLLLTVVALAVCGAVALTSIAGASEAAKTRVTIQVEGRDFSGKVKSPRLHKCADNRKVKLYKQKGPEQNPRTEEVVASDTSELNGDHGEWSTGNTGLSGKFYARAGRKPGCRPDSSRTLHTEP